LARWSFSITGGRKAARESDAESPEDEVAKAMEMFLAEKGSDTM
jgi:hypothetical protein